MAATAYDVDENGNENRILFWLRLDLWQMTDAALLFADIDPDSIEYNKGALSFAKFKTLNGSIYDLKQLTSVNFDENFEKVDQQIDEMQNYESKYKDMFRWLNNIDTSLDTPANWIKRAQAKKITIPWLDLAIEQGFYNEAKINLEIESDHMRIFDEVYGSVGTPIPQATKTQTNIFDKSSATYPPELDFALQAWQAVVNSEGKGKPKARIKNWLNDHTTLSEEAKNRIATVANWDKLGGATRSD